MTYSFKRETRYMWVGIILGLGVQAAWGQPTNDYCASLKPITGEGLCDYSLLNATSDGPPDLGTHCNVGDSDALPDVWFCWKAKASGNVRISLYFEQDVYVLTAMQVYEGCSCPPTPKTFLDCALTDHSISEDLFFAAQVNQEYLVRVSAMSSSIATSFRIAYDSFESDFTSDQYQQISGEGRFSFENLPGSVNDAPPVRCSLETGVDPLLYCWTSPCTGTVTVDTCGGTPADTTMSPIVESTTCFPPAFLYSQINEEGDYHCPPQATRFFEAAEGMSYSFGIGTKGASATGFFTIECRGPPDVPCDYVYRTNTRSYCHVANQRNALTSNGGSFRVIDDVVAHHGDYGEQIESICWWGTYFDGDNDCRYEVNDNFRVTYYLDAGGLPGAGLAGPFFQSNGTLTVIGPERTNLTILESFPEYAYSATHAPVPAVEGQTIWVEIANDLAGSCYWLWETSGRNNSKAIHEGVETSVFGGLDPRDIIAQDLALCLNVYIVDPDSLDPMDPYVPSPPLNDNCSQAQPILEGETDFITLGATTDGGDLPSCEFPVGDDQIHADVWFDYEASCTGLATVELCDVPFDSKVAVYEGTACPPTTRLACNDDLCGEFILHAAASFPAIAGNTYKIRVGGYRGSTGFGTLRVECGVADCNGNTQADWIDLATGLAVDCNGDGTLDRCEPADFDGNGVVELADLPGCVDCLSGPCGSSTCEPTLFTDPCCEAGDVEGNQAVDLRDFAYFQRAFLIAP